MQKTNVTQKYDILDCTPHWGHKTISVIAWNTELKFNERHVISFADLAAAFDPDGEGNQVTVVLTLNGNDAHSGPWSEPKEVPLSAHEFVKDLYEISSDSVLTEDMRKAYMSQLHEAISEIIEGRDAE